MQEAQPDCLPGILERLITRFGHLLPAAAISETVAASRLDLLVGSVPATALPELLERSAAQRLAALASPAMPAPATPAPAWPDRLGVSTKPGPGT